MLHMFTFERVGLHNVAKIFMSSWQSVQHKFIMWVYKWLYRHGVNVDLLLMIIFCFQSHSRWWQCLHTCYIIRANAWQVGFCCCIRGHFFGVLKVFEKFFSLFKGQVRPNGDVYDFEVNKKSNHLIWCECPMHLFVDHVDSCICHKFIFNISIWDV